MSRKALLVLIAIIFIALVGWVYVVFKSPSGGSQSGNPSKGIGSLFPFGAGESTGGATTPSGSSSTETNPTPPNTASNRLVQISDKVVAGIAVLSPVVRFAEAGTGNIYDTDAKGQNLKKMSDTVIAHAAYALFSGDGKAVLLRYAKNDNRTIASFLGMLVEPSADGSTAGMLKGDFLPDNITDATISPDGKSFLLLTATANGSVLMSESTDGTKRKQVLVSPFSEWLLDWVSSGIILTTKAAGSVQGSVYKVLSSGTLEKITSGVYGLTTKASPNGKLVLYSTSIDTGVPSLRIRNLANNTSLDTGLRTLPEKCVWARDSSAVYCGVPLGAPTATYPDSWYQGITHFADTFWKIDATVGTTTQVDDGEKRGTDATYLALDRDEKYLFFINKNTGTPWSLDLTVPVVAPLPEPSLFNPL